MGRSRSDSRSRSPPPRRDRERSSSRDRERSRERGRAPVRLPRSVPFLSAALTTCHPSQPPRGGGGGYGRNEDAKIFVGGLNFATGQDAVRKCALSVQLVRTIHD